MTDDAPLYCDDRLWVKMLHLPKKGMTAVQHKHDFPHVTLLSAGEVDVFMEGLPLGRRRAPCVIHVAAKRLHAFVSASDGVVLSCIHALEDGELIPRHEKVDLIPELE